MLTGHSLSLTICQYSVYVNQNVLTEKHMLLKMHLNQITKLLSFFFNITV